MEVQCPEGVQAGMLVSFEAVDGTWMEVVVQEGVLPGDFFLVDSGGAEGSPSLEDKLHGMSLSAGPSPAGHDLVLALVEHATSAISMGPLASYLEAHCHCFDQSEEELQSGAGHTLDQFSYCLRITRQISLEPGGATAC